MLVWLTVAVAEVLLGLEGVPKTTDSLAWEVLAACKILGGVEGLMWLDFAFGVDSLDDVACVVWVDGGVEGS